jgi:hypothetical protein
MQFIQSILLVLALAPGIVLEAQILRAQIPYGDFEVWEGDDSLFINPFQWSSLNEIHHQLGFREYTVTRSEEAVVKGHYALQVQTRRFCDSDSDLCYLVPGMAVLGDLFLNPFDLSVITPGLPYNERPAYLRMYMLYYPVEMDTMQLVVELSRADPNGGKQVVAIGDFRFSEHTLQFEPIDVDLEYFSDAQPEKIRIVVYSGTRNHLYLEPYPNGSRVIIDQMRLGGSKETTTGWTDATYGKRDWLIYPIPTSENLHIQYQALALGQETLSITLYDLAGHELHQSTIFQPFEGASISLPMTDLAPGHYLLSIRNKEGRLLHARQVVRVP